MTTINVMRIILTLFMVVLAALAALNSGHVSVVQLNVPAPVSVLGQSEKICQLNGEKDWASGKFTAARTMTNAGLDAADLGYPVEHAGKLLFFFGDSWPPNHVGGAAGELPPDDAVGVTSRTQTPDQKKCVGLTIQTSAPKTFARATVTGPISIHQGFFNVPSGGISAGGKLYAFFWTDHCDSPSKLSPSPGAPLASVTPSVDCPETAERSSIGRSVLARSVDDGLTYTIPTSEKRAVSMPIGFVYATAVNTNTIHGLPADERLGVLIFAAPRYRASIPYLAYAPVSSFADPSSWKFFSGFTHNKPHWVSADAWAKNSGPKWAPPGQAELFTPDTDAGRCVGEFSVTWNRPLRSWLMLYNCGSTILARVASAPWGPWSSPTTLLSKADPSVFCTLVMRSTGCGSQRNYWPKNKAGMYVEGGFYAPFVLNRYTLDASGGATRSATIFWVVSTWNPYEVVVMRTTLKSGLASPAPRPSYRPPPSIHPVPVPSHPI